MAQLIWHYLQNQFLNATENSYRLMNIVNADHLSRLKAEQGDPDILALVTRTEPLHDTFNDKFTNWKAATGQYKGGTDVVEKLLRQLSSDEIQQWDIDIQVVHLEGTSQYIAILPNRRKPFQNGTIDERISEVKALSKRLDAFPALAAVKTSVDAFYTTIKGARDEQQQREEAVEATSKEVRDASTALAWMMYRNLGSLMDKYGEDVESITKFWELALIRDTGGANAPQFEGTVNPSETVNIISEDITDESTFVIVNTGTVPLHFCATSAELDVCGTGTPTVLAGESRTFTTLDLGTSGATFLNCTNAEATAGEYMVTLL